MMTGAGRRRRERAHAGGDQLCRVERRQGMSLSGRLRAPALALAVALGFAAAGVPAGAVEPPPGTKNFSPPGYVPNYFSNESGPFQGGANARNAQSETTPFVAAPGSRGRVAVASRGGPRHHGA